MRKTSALVIFLVSIVAAAQAQNFAVGTCRPQYPHFPTIQLAVSGVTPGSTIFVCPNVYPEQVTITQPLTLQGVASSNQDRPVITVPSGDPASGGGLQANATDPFGTPIAAQVGVQNLTPAGSVNLINLTVDGAGAATNCSGVSNVYLAGIFYGVGTSGAVKGSTIKNQSQAQPGCGYGIWVVSDSGPTQTIEISNNSIHDFDARGIWTECNVIPPTLSVEILSNSVHSNTASASGIVSGFNSGDIAHNVVTGGNDGIFVDASFAVQSAGTNITDNDVSDASTGIDSIGGTVIKSNRISNTAYGVFLVASAGFPPAITSNNVKNTNVAVEYNCTPSTTVKSNVITDALIAFDQVPPARGSLYAINQVSDVDTVATPCQ